MCSLHSFTVDVLTQGSWRLLNELDDPELKDLAIHSSTGLASPSAH